jgi:trk system potassium uptake protein TrkH
MGGFRKLSPPQLFAASFLVLIALGTLGLRFVPAFYVERQPLGWIDALFTATSAVCVTGLIVVDTATHFTRLGQGFILLLIQIGGLGMLTITSLITLGLGRRLSLRTESVVPLMPSSLRDVALRRLIRDIVLFTLVIELVGAGAQGIPIGSPVDGAVAHEAALSFPGTHPTLSQDHNAPA